MSSQIVDQIVDHIVAQIVIFNYLIHDLAHAKRVHHLIHNVKSFPLEEFFW